MKELGGSPVRQVKGIELDTLVHGYRKRELTGHYGLHPDNLVNADFFSTDTSQIGPVDAVVGNPPFIRYQRFKGTARELAMLRAAAEGVRLSELSSSWAPFLVHSVGLLSEGGRLAMVIPMEFSHSAYARPLHAYLRKQFRSLKVLTFREPLFPGLSQDVLLLLAEGRGTGVADQQHLELTSGAELSRLDMSRLRPTQSFQRITRSRLKSPTSDLYDQLAAHPNVIRLGDVARVSIGYVSGANGYFNLTPDEASHWKLPDSVLFPAVFRGKALQGLLLTEQDWTQATRMRQAGYVFSAGPAVDSAAVRTYLAHCTSHGVPLRYKCRVRKPWHQVPGIEPSEGLLTYMSGREPLLVATATSLTAPNTLLTVNTRPGSGTTIHSLAAGWQSSLTKLSTELEGHALGGGMLKLEPGEARNVLLPRVLDTEVLTHMDAAFRRNDRDELRRMADQLLMEATGISITDCRRLAEEAAYLGELRHTRGRTGTNPAHYWLPVESG